MAYGARLERGLGLIAPQGFKSPILRRRPPGPRDQGVFFRPYRVIRMTGVSTSPRLTDTSTLYTAITGARPSRQTDDVLAEDHLGHEGPLLAVEYAPSRSRAQPAWSVRDLCPIPLNSAHHQRVE